MTSQDKSDPWVSKTLLSIDGGGERGLASLFLLKHLMDKIGKYERERNSKAISSVYSSPIAGLGGEVLNPKSSSDYLPCHYFGYIGGASTGGSITLMLGRLRMNVDDAIEEYKKLCLAISPENLPLLKGIFPKHYEEQWRQTVKNQFDRLALDHQMQAFGSDPARCRTFIFNLDDHEGDPKHASYSRDYDFADFSRTIGWKPSTGNRYSISDVAFRPLRDALSFDANCGAVLNRSDSLLLHETSVSAQETVDVLLSIGGGDWGDEKSYSSKRPETFPRPLENYSSWAETLETRARQRTEDLGADYYRWNVEGIPMFVRLQEWKPKKTGAETIKKVQEAAEKFVRRDSIASEIEKLAKFLVDKRIQRSTTFWWEPFAMGTRYRCTFEKCPEGKDVVFPHRKELMNHSQRYHEGDFGVPGVEQLVEIQSYIDRGKFKPEETVDSGSWKKSFGYVGAYCSPFPPQTDKIDQIMLGSPKSQKSES